jgi:hypothetical protein
VYNIVVVGWTFSSYVITEACVDLKKCKRKIEELEDQDIKIVVMK